MEPESFLRQALIYLAAGVLAVPLFKRAGLGSVLGYLAAGIAIGPWGLGLISEAQTVLHFAEIGVVLLLFLIGLELDPRRLWEMRRPILGMGSTQLVATGAALGLIAWALGLSKGAAFVIGMSLAMSSTAIGLATLQEKQLLGAPGGQASLSVLLFQDLAVIPLLLVLPIVEGGHAAIDWQRLGIGAGVVVALVLGGRLLLRPTLRFIAGTGLREVFVAFALLLVIGFSALMQSLGLSQGLGAFLAGVLLADSEYRHEIEIDIDPFKGLLLGLFFIAIGMSVDLGLFVSAPLLVVGIAAGVVLLKIALLYPIARAYGYCRPRDGALFALALSQVGEFAFVLLTAAGRIVPPQAAEVLDAVVAISMASTPLVFIVYERFVLPRLGPRTERATNVLDEANPVIVAGFGRFGQVVTRVLNGLGVRATLIDHDPDQIETVRRFGIKAYYGDATRMDVLEAAGAAHARLLVVAIDEPRAAMTVVTRARRRFPHLALVARAHGRTDAYEYVELGVPAVRETFGSALYAAEAALRALGYGAPAARRVVQRFRRHDEEILLEQAPHRTEAQQLIALQQRGRRDLQRLLARELGKRPEDGDD